MDPRIFLDNNSGTPIAPELIPLICDLLKKEGGNPSSQHQEGKHARFLLNQSRKQIADLLRVKPQEIFFSSCATESLNMALRGIAPPPCHIITSSVEHAAVYNTCRQMEKMGYQITYLSPGPWGCITREQVEVAIQPTTALIALMAVNNETGVCTDLEGLSSLALAHDLPLLVDGVAWIGKAPLRIPDGVSIMCFSGYKFHAPPGIGLTFISSKRRVQPLIWGGEQEYGRRGGTENLPFIVASAEALKLALFQLEEKINQMKRLRDRLEEELIRQLEGVVINGEGPRVCNSSNLSFEGVEGELLLARLDQRGIAVSHGSACSSGAMEPSRVLMNMGLGRQRAASAIRFSLSRFTTAEEIERTIYIVTELVTSLRA